jgi:hydrogenase large subunit
MDQAMTREDVHAWYDGRRQTPSMPPPIQKNTVDHGKYSWAVAVRHDENGRLEAGRWRAG